MNLEPSEPLEPVATVATVATVEHYISEVSLAQLSTFDTNTARVFLTKENYPGTPAESHRTTESQPRPHARVII